MAWARPLLVRQKNTREPARKLVRHFLEGQHVSGADRTFDFKRFAIKFVITLKRFDDEEVDREPNRSAPVRVATKKITCPLARNVINAMFIVANAEDIGVVTMDPRHGT